MKLCNAINRILNYNLHTNVYALARSCLAFGTLVTLLTNPLVYLFPSEKTSADGTFLDAINLFSCLGYNHLVYAKWIACAILLGVIVGYLPQITGLLHFWVAFSFHAAVTPVEGGDQLSAILALLLIPITLGDKRMNHWHKANNQPKNNPFLQIFAYSALLIVWLQVSVVYFFSSIEKLKTNEWTDGSALYYWSRHWLFGFNEGLDKLISPIFHYPLLIHTATWGVMLLELLLCMAIVMSRKAKKKILLAGLIFHFLIFVFLGLFSFFFAMAGALVLYLWPLHQSFKGINLTKVKLLTKQKSLQIKT